MIAFIRDLWNVLVGHRKGLLLFIGITVVVIVAAGLFLSYKSQQSSFCDTCHYMDPYVRHWQASSHANVDCVKCHDYGLAALTLSTLKLATNTYDTRPKAIVPNKNCMGSDCHDQATLDQGIQFKKGIIFQHTVHLGQALRGEQLRCTSCHNQIVQYDDENQGHMVVNDKACFICHFKDAGAGEAITGCNSCHGMPKKKVEHAGFVFDHEPYLKLNVQCKQCHVNVVKGDGSVPEAKCYSCHVERSRGQYSRAQLHEIHVTENGVDCYKCHSEIDHGNYGLVSALDIECESCHLRQHNKPRQLYMGIGGSDSLDMPSQMFAAQVSCTGCHTHVTPEGEVLAEQEKKEAGRNSCVTCHGKDYDLMFDNWLEGTAAAIRDYRTYTVSARNDYTAAGGSNQAKQKARAALGKVEENFNFLREGHIPHNIWYALYLMNTSADEFERAMTTVNKAYKAPSRGVTTREASCVTFCHGKAFQPETVVYEDRTLPHRQHTGEIGFGCESCHSVTEHGKTEINKSVCADCH